MTAQNITSSTPKRDRAKALVMLGLVAGALYAAPLVADLTPAQASGGGGGRGGWFGQGGGGSGGGNGGGGSGMIATASDPLTAKECGACHIAYAPQYLPAGSWQQIMSNLQNHFGEDASLSQQQAQQIGSYLVNNAGGGGNGPLRITDTNWWTREHRGEVSSWQRQKAGKMSNCAGCHQVMGQGRGNFGNYGDQGNWGKQSNNLGSRNDRRN